MLSAHQAFLFQSRPLPHSVPCFQMLRMTIEEMDIFCLNIPEYSASVSSQGSS